jgi:hypothetical protein
VGKEPRFVAPRRRQQPCLCDQRRRRHAERHRPSRSIRRWRLGVGHRSGRRAARHLP